MVLGSDSILGYRNDLQQFSMTRVHEIGGVHVATTNYESFIDETRPGNYTCWPVQQDRNDGRRGRRFLGFVSAGASLSSLD
jgi:hypothetical protein